MIDRVVLQNFKKFVGYEASLDKSRNIFVGDNDSGKSSLLTAIDLTLSGSRYKVEKLGLESLFNTDAVSKFLAGEPSIAALPEVVVEIYLNPRHEEFLKGKNNSLKKNSEGLRMVISPDPDLDAELREFIGEKTGTFPFDYYEVTFKTFKGVPYAGFQKHVRHILLDGSKVSASSAMREFIHNAYDMHVSGAQERAKHSAAYRLAKNKFRDDSLKDINERVGQIDSYQFELRTGMGSSLESDLTISEKNVALENSGQGRQSLIKTEFSLKKSKRPIDIVLLEEPENHLSHSSISKLIALVEAGIDKQVLIATHSNMIASKLDLRNCYLIGAPEAGSPVAFRKLTEDTAEFFMKSPTNNVLDLSLSHKTILVEGAAEYILLEALFKKHTGSLPEALGVQIITVNGLSFKRYIEVGNILRHRIAVIRDNDGNYAKNCVENYAGLILDKKQIQVFGDKDSAITTFEKAIYRDNTALCDRLFKQGRKTLSVLEYMLKDGNKSEAAFALVQHANELKVPGYIQEAINWINS